MRERRSAGSIRQIKFVIRRIRVPDGPRTTRFYKHAFGVLTHWAFESAPVLAGRFDLYASEHHLGAALCAFRT
jgi:hypothetical protein